MACSVDQRGPLEFLFVKDCLLLISQPILFDRVRAENVKIFVIAPLSEILQVIGKEWPDSVNLLPEAYFGLSSGSWVVNYEAPP